MVPDRLRKALEPFNPTYTPGKYHGEFVTIPGADRKWFVSGESSLAGPVYEVGEEGLLNHESELSHRVNELNNPESIYAEGLLPNLVYSMVTGSRKHKIGDNELNLWQQSASVGNGKFENRQRTVLRKGDKVYRLDTHPKLDVTGQADLMPERIWHGINEVFGGADPAPLIDELLDHHNAHSEHFARSLAAALRLTAVAKQ
jgi:hypothetical protein